MTISALKCNLGIRKLWRGVECDLRATREAPMELGRACEQEQLREFNFTDSRLVQDLDLRSYLDLVAKESMAARDFLLEAKNRQRVMIGGDHMVSFASVLADLQDYPAEDIGVLMFDSHDDINLSQDSATGNFHGMWLRPLLTKFDHEKIEALVSNKIPKENLLYVGNLDMEPLTAKFFEEQNLEVINGEVLKRDFLGLMEMINNFANKFAHLHLTFDLDVVKGQAEVTKATSGNWAVNLPYDGGLEIGLIKKIWQNLQLPKSLAFDLVEYNGARTAGKESTQSLARELLQTVIK